MYDKLFSTKVFKQPTVCIKGKKDIVDLIAVKAATEVMVNFFEKNVFSLWFRVGITEKHKIVTCNKSYVNHTYILKHVAISLRVLL